MDSKILIIDDEKEYLQMAMSYIVEESIPNALLFAPNGKVGIEVAIKEIPDIIIIDWEMPEMNGIDAIRKLKEIEATKDIPVIMSTGIRLSPDDLKTAFEAGASDFIRKPMEKTEFIARVTSHLRMAGYINTIIEKRNLITETATEHLNEKVYELQTRIDENKTQITFYNDVLESITSKLEIIKYNGDNIKENINSVINQIQQSVKKIKNIFSGLEKPNETFVKSLLKKHSNLTPQEIQLSFLLKNNLSSKDIATITFREESSVKVMRSRLRKKLRLEETVNLVSYMERI